MKIKILGIVVEIHKKEKRPKWKKVKRFEHSQNMANNVLSNACFLYLILKDALTTHCRYYPLPDCRKLISKTLSEMDYTPAEIHKYLGKYLGDRTTIIAQIKHAENRNRLSHKEYFKRLDAMREVFVD